MENGQCTFMVMVKKTDGSWEGLGSHSFAVPPRTGEYVGFDDTGGKGQAYRVKAVLHPLDPSVTAGDLILEYVSTSLDLRKKL
jgi:hypothetical protein